MSEQRDQSSHQSKLIVRRVDARFIHANPKVPKGCARREDQATAHIEGRSGSIGSISGRWLNNSGDSRLPDRFGASMNFGQILPNARIGSTDIPRRSPVCGVAYNIEVLCLVRPRGCFETPSDPARRLLHLSIRSPEKNRPRILDRRSPRLSAEWDRHESY